MNNHFSDLQVDHASQYPKYPSPGPHETGAHAGSEFLYSDKIGRDGQPHLEVGQPRRRGRICGLAARTFWIVAAVIAVIVIAAAVGGGVGGGLAGKSKSTASASAPTSSSPGQTLTSTPASPTSSSAISSSLATTTSIPSTSTISISTSTTIGPTETLLVDCPSSNNTLYTPPSSNQVYRKVCGTSFTSNGYNVVNAPTASLDACIALAASYNVESASAIAAGAANVCNAVCWRATIDGDDWPGQCFGFTTTNSSGAFVYAEDVRCDSAAWVNQNV